MKKMKLKKRIVTIICVSVFCILAIVGGLLLNLSKDVEVEVYGGDMVKYSLAAYSGATLSYELPLIVNQKIDLDKFMFMGFNTNIGNNVGQIINFNKISDPFKYKKWYCYYINLDVDTSKIKEDIIVDSVDFKINGKLIEYKIDTFKISNVQSVIGEDYNCEQYDIVIEDEPPVMYQILPNNEQTIIYEIKEDCVVEKLELQDFIEIKDEKYYVNDVRVENKNGISVCKGDRLSISYQLRYEQGIRDYDMIKTGVYLKYTEANSMKYALVGEQGIVVIHFQDDRHLKDYVNNEL